MLYEVNLAVDPAILPTFEPWLREHVAEMLAIDGFLEATIYRLEPAADGYASLAVHYRLDSREALERYFAEHADRMRAEGAARFGDHMRATRRILEPREQLIA